ncbi:Ribosomal protein L11 methyltransferase [Defluviimonas aquaemixtae]|uniref:Ribosomal protein L11 methyltransferase n=1 Tax=Albidovulum aquaemixtae TaxID=1542388 RepID=A0A2R8BME7_9RHOB|nr:50S ribosomal protein L11 methyltransferase [Defluviimonas aquaemixtae]SPH24596.1 Ribosomal protein L11 methyltransferase [Defluviimonas aquaemixtae]
MATFSALTTLPAREPAEALAEAMEKFLPEPSGIGCSEIEDGTGMFEVGVYFDDRPDEIELALMAAIYGAKPFAVSEIPETDWVAHVKRELQPVEAGRFFVYGSHDADRVPDGRVALLIEAAMAFGTGHHATTKGCLLALDRLDQAGFRGGNVADIGCGTAVLAMAAASIWPSPVIAADIDPVAVEVAEANVAANGLARQVRCVEAAGFDHSEITGAMPFDLIFANILKAPLIELAPAMARAVRSDGYVILSGILDNQADDVSRIYENVGFSPISRDDIGEWATLVLKRGQ